MKKILRMMMMMMMTTEEEEEEEEEDANDGGVEVSEEIRRGQDDGLVEVGFPTPL
jgi:hypothetical protein